MSIEEASFLGGADFQPGEDTYADAFETARLVAENGITILNGGGSGVMRVTIEGAQATGGHVIGVTCTRPG